MSFETEGDLMQEAHGLYLKQFRKCGFAVSLEDIRTNITWGADTSTFWMDPELHGRMLHGIAHGDRANPLQTWDVEDYKRIRAIEAALSGKGASGDYVMGFDLAYDHDGCGDETARVMFVNCKFPEALEQHYTRADAVEWVGLHRTQMEVMGAGVSVRVLHRDDNGQDIVFESPSGEVSRA